MASLRNTVHLPVLAAELPPGWGAFESAEFVAPSGRVVRVDLGGAEAGLDAVGLVESRLALLRDSYGEPTETSSAVRRWRGSQNAHLVTIRFDEPAASWVIAGVVDGQAGLTVSTALASPDDDGTGDVEAVLAGIRLLSGPIARPAWDSSDVEGPSLAERPTVASEIWAQLHRAWSEHRGVVHDPITRTVWSPDELATVATVLGAPSFPSVGTEVFAALTDDELGAVLGATTRSLIARGILHAAPDGSLRLADDVRSELEIAVFPDLSIMVESGGVGEPAATYFGVRPDAAVRIDAAPTGGRTCGAVDPAGLVDALAALLAQRDSTQEDPGETVRLEAGELAERWMSMESAWQISSTWRAGSLVSGRVLYVARDANGRVWVTEPDDHEAWTLRPVGPTEIRDEILACLPGGS
jgi:hypothetical protein